MPLHVFQYVTVFEKPIRIVGSAAKCFTSAGSLLVLLVGGRSVVAIFPLDNSDRRQPRNALDALGGGYS